MKKVVTLFLTMVLFISFNNHSQLSAQINETKVPAIDKKTLENWMYFLSSDSMRGRKNGSPEMKTAANWIAKQFKECGLKSFSNNDSSCSTII